MEGAIYFACCSEQEARALLMIGDVLSADTTCTTMLCDDLRQSKPRGPTGRGFMIRRIENHAAVEAFAVAFGAQVGLVAEGEVDDAALA